MPSRLESLPSAIRGLALALSLSSVLAACAYGSVGGAEEDLDEESGENGPGGPTDPNAANVPRDGGKDASKDSGKDAARDASSTRDATDVPPDAESSDGSRDGKATDDANTTDSAADTGAVVVDANVPDVRVVDANVPDARVMDAGAPDVSVVVDAGRPDVTVPPVEAGTPPVDAGTPPVDAGTMPDVTVPPVDAGSTPDAADPVDAADDSGATEMGTATWATDATAHRCQRLQRFAYECPPGGSANEIWGSSIFSDDSSICTAAVHDGKITFANGGRIVVEMRPGERIYRSVTRNGVTSTAYTVPTGQPNWPCSFVTWPW
ncbi:MAG: LCCL domain-containing protein [Polyangiaceae bacterium]